MSQVVSNIETVSETSNSSEFDENLENYLPKRRPGLGWRAWLEMSFPI